MKTTKKITLKHILNFTGLFLMLIGVSAVVTGCGDKNGGDTPSHYIVTFDADGGTPTPATQRVAAGTAAKAPTTAPAKQGYAFLHWSLSGTDAAYDFKTPVTKDITLKAKWQDEADAEYWQITWDLGGGQWPVDDNHADKVVQGQKLAEPNAPIRAGFVFESWYADELLTNKVIFPYEAEADMTLYAKWADGPKTYYVSNTGGDDENDGLSEQTAWETVGKASQSAELLKPGDSVLFKRGDTWTGVTLRIYNVSGTAAERITYGAYGSGDKPKLIGTGNGDGLMGVIVVRNSRYLTIENFDISNPAPSYPPAVNVRGISVEVQVSGNYEGITIKDNYIHDVEAQHSSSWHLNGGIWARGTHAEGLLTELLIENNKLERIAARGIQIGDQADKTDEAYYNYDMTIRGNEINETTFDGILVYKTIGLTIESNKITKVGTYKLFSVDYNRALNAMELRAKNVTVRLNEIGNTARMGTSLDAQAIAIHDNAAGTWLVERNYSYNNQGGFTMISGAAQGISSAKIRYNISENDGVEGTRYKIFKFGSTDYPVEIYNNTVYQATEIGILNNSAGETHTNLSFKNNIFYTPKLTNENSAIVFDSNLYYTTAKIDADANAVTSNPNLVSPGNGVAGYKLPAGSPAAGAGAIISGNGGKDYFGNTVSATSKPTIGAFQL